MAVRRRARTGGAGPPQRWGLRLAGPRLIFSPGVSELGMHPTSPDQTTRHHQISLMCDDLEATMAELAQRGAVFTSGPQDDGFGITAMMQVPGADDMLLYEPRHVTAYDA